MAAGRTGTERFGSYISNGSTATFFLPDPRIHRMGANLDYFLYHPSNRGALYKFGPGGNLMPVPYVAVMERFTCPVCGWPELWECPDDLSLEICPSCGIQFGYTDSPGVDPVAWLEARREWRKRWLANGAAWSSPPPRPAHWDGERQLAEMIRGGDPLYRN